MPVMNVRHVRARPFEHHIHWLPTFRAGQSKKELRKHAKTKILPFQQMFQYLTLHDNVFGDDIRPMLSGKTRRVRDYFKIGIRIIVFIVRCRFCCNG
jgi:hypothetical protein